MNFRTLIVFSFRKYRLYNVKQIRYPVKEKKRKHIVKRSVFSIKSVIVVPLFIDRYNCNQQHICSYDCVFYESNTSFWLTMWDTTFFTFPLQCTFSSMDSNSTEILFVSSEIKQLIRVRTYITTIKSIGSKTLRVR